TRDQIRTQFLSEAIMLAFVGGAVGVAAGALATGVYASTKHWAVVIPATAWAGGGAAAVATRAIARPLPPLPPAPPSPPPGPPSRQGGSARRIGSCRERNPRTRCAPWPVFPEPPQEAPPCPGSTRRQGIRRRAVRRRRCQMGSSR